MLAHQYPDFKFHVGVVALLASLSYSTISLALSFQTKSPGYGLKLIGVIMTTTNARIHIDKFIFIEIGYIKRYVFGCVFLKYI